MKEVNMLYKLNFKSNSTIADSIKISGAIINAYSILYPDKIDEFISYITAGEISFSDIFPYENEPLFSMPPLNNLIDTSINKKQQKELIKNRKNMPKYINYTELINISKNFMEHSYDGIKNYSFKKANVNFKTNISETGNHILETPKKNKEKEVYIYNEVYSRELYAYNSAFFIIHNCIKEIQKNIDASVNLLNDFGISGRLSTGKGKIRVERGNDELETEFKSEGLYMLLSSFIPSNNDIKFIDFNKSRYNINIFQGKDRLGKPVGPFRYIMPGAFLYIRNNLKGCSFNNGNRIMVFNPVIMRM